MSAPEWVVEALHDKRPVDTPAGRGVVEVAAKRRCRVRVGNVAAWYRFDEVAAVPAPAWQSLAQPAEYCRRCGMSVGHWAGCTAA